MPWIPLRQWLPIGVYRTFPLPILSILKPKPYKPYVTASVKIKHASLKEDLSGACLSSEVITAKY